MKNLQDDQEQVDYVEMPGPSGEGFTVPERTESSMGGGGAQIEQQSKKLGWRGRAAAWREGRLAKRRLEEIRNQLAKEGSGEAVPTVGTVNDSKESNREEAYEAALKELQPFMDPSEPGPPREKIEERLAALRRGEQSSVLSKPSRFEQAVMDLVKKYGEEVLDRIYPESELQKRGRERLERLREEAE